MSTRNERFNKHMRRMDGSGAATDRHDALSDHGLGVMRMLEAIDWEESREREEENRPEHLSPVEHDLVQILNGVWLEMIGLRHLVRTLDLICQHGRFREESVGELAGPVRHRNLRRFKAATRKYQRDLRLLLKLYLGQY